jgi:hypothetical protein
MYRAGHDGTLIPAHSRIRQKNHELKTSLGYVVRPGLKKNKQTNKQTKKPTKM